MLAETFVTCGMFATSAMCEKFVVRFAISATLESEMCATLGHPSTMPEHLSTMCECISKRGECIRKMDAPEAEKLCIGIEAEVEGEDPKAPECIVNGTSRDAGSCRSNPR